MPEGEVLYAPFPIKPSDRVVKRASEMLRAGYGLVMGPVTHIRVNGYAHEFRVKSKGSDDWYETHVDMEHGRGYCSCQGFGHGYCSHVHVCRCILSNDLRESTLAA